ncbi:MAG TPA: nuclear transport factor 2 family protein [Halalkalibaculum sp.]|nr:nuclear transport factor 2 family protein [Halalkalibaculum sp.]
MCRIKSLQLSILTITFLLFANITTVYAQANNLEELKQTINDNYDQFTQFIKDNNPGELAETLYTKDAKFYPPNGGIVEGTEGVTKAFKGLIGAGLVIEPEAQEVEIFGNHAYEYGIGTVYNKEGKKIRRERYVCIWKNIDGDWKIYRDLVQGVQIQ